MLEYFSVMRLILVYVSYYADIVFVYSNYSI